MKRQLHHLQAPAALCVLAAAAAAALLNACHAPQTGDDLFPLDAGHRWEYVVTTENENELPERSALAISAMGRDDLEGVATWRRRSEDGLDYWLQRDDTGIYRVATKTDLEEEPKRDEQRRYVIKQPLAVGTNWRASTTPYLLKRRQEFPRELKHTHPSVPMQYTIDALNVSVKVAAGEFTNCTQIKGIATVRVYADPIVGWKDLPITTTETYCRGVGLVKLVREEPAQSTFLTGGTMTLELQRFQ